MVKNSRSLIQAQQPRLIELYQAGVPFGEIGRELGLTAGGVEYRVAELVKAGLLERRPVLKRGARPETAGQADELRRRYEAGETWEQLAEWLGVTVQAVQHRVKMAGITPDRAVPHWETAQDWPWPLTLEEVAVRMYGSGDAVTRRRASYNIHNWTAQGKLIRVGWARYDLPRFEQSAGEESPL